MGDDMEAGPPSDGFEEVIEFIRENRGFDFTGYKRPSLRRRVEKRMSVAGFTDFGAYRTHLERHPDEFADLFNTILINVTRFFRDDEPWDAIGNDVIPRIAAGKDPEEPIRVWVAGCASGEEAFTIAMLFAETLGESALQSRVKIYATDVDDHALAAARQGDYPAADVQQSVPEPLVEKYFDRSDGRYVFRKDLRRSVIFGRHDLVQDPPISRVDLLSCRNTLMYFQGDTQRRILENFHFALAETGFLVLGRSEVLVTRTNLFTAYDLKRRIFTRVPMPLRDRVGRQITVTRPDEPRPLEFDAIRDAAFDAVAMPQLVVDLEGRLALANHQARALFNLSAKDIGRQFSDLEVSYRPVELRSRIDEARSERHNVSIGDVELSAARSGELRQFDVQLAPLLGPNGSVLAVTIGWTEVTRFRRLQDELLLSQRELETAYEELQSTVEELETTNEELQSTNEELETTNEELQSTNEELETMNEELQSTNEELETMNDELRQRTDDLNDANTFMEAVFASLQAGVVVLSPELTVRVWTRQAQTLWGLPAEEVIGQHFLNLDIGLPVDELRQPVRDVLASRDSFVTVTVPAINRTGRNIECRVTVSPLRTRTAEAHGLILLMEDVQTLS